MNDIQSFHIKLLRILALILSASYKQNEIVNHPAFLNFLKHYIPDKNHKEYITIFEEIIAEYESEGRLKKISSNSVKLISYSQEINKQFIEKNRILLWLRLFDLVKDYISDNYEISDYEKLLADSLYIDEEKQESLRYFCVNIDDGGFKDISAPKKGIIVWKDEESKLNLIKVYTDEVFVNDRKLPKNKILELNPGLQVSFSNGDSFSYSDLIDFDNTIKKSFGIELRQVAHFYKNKQVLASLSLSVTGSSLVALLGRSGSGKTSLLKLISGMSKLEHGEIEFFGKNKETINTAYVAQHEAFIPEFSVKEILCDRLKLLKTLNKTSAENFDEEILRVVDLVGLSNQLNQKAGKESDSQLSGGQIKKLSLALQLLSSPQVLLVDEPLSGLSAADAYEIMQVLKNLANNNCLVICSLHQPSYDLLQICDQSLILDKNGYAVYFGETAEMAKYIRQKAASPDSRAVPCSGCFSYNPADIFNIIEEKKIDEYGKIGDERKLSQQEWNKWFNEIHPKKELIGENKKTVKSKSNFFKLFAVFFTRDIKRMAKRKFYNIGVFLSVVVLFLLIAFISKGNEAQYFYGTNPNIPVAFLMMIISGVFIGMMISGNEICGDRSFRLGENLLGKHNFAWLSSKIIRMFLISVILAFILIFISFPILQVPLSYLAYSLFFSLIIFHGVALGLLLSAMFKNLSSVYFLVPLIIIPQLILSGLIIDFKNFPNAFKNEKYTPLVSDIAVSRWAYEAMLCDAFMNNNWQKQFYSYDYQKNEASFYLNIFLKDIEALAVNNQDEAIEKLNNQLSLDGHKVLRFEDFETIIEVQKSFFSNQLNSAISSIQTIQEQLSKVYDLSDLKNKNHNKQIALLVSGASFASNFSISDKPSIFKLPTNSYGRSHYFSPAKKIGNSYMDSFYFNTIIISILNFILCTILLVIRKNKY